MGGPGVRRIRGATLAAAAVAALAAAGCGSDGGDDDPGGGEALHTVTGNGYAFGVPSSWRSRKDEVTATSDAAVAAGDAVRDQLWADAPPGAEQPYTNLATTYDPLPAQGTTGPQTLEALAEATRTSVSAGDRTTIEPAPDTTLGGDPAKELVVTTSAGADRLEQRAILAIHGGRLYVLTSTASAANGGAAKDALDDARSSWRWR